MYRVLFRVIRISIHIKQQLSLEVLFRKNTQTILEKDSYPLVEGIANINVTTEFLITKSQPSFEVHVNFTFKKLKKQAGYIQINLCNWQQGSCYQQSRILQNSPGGKATIQFGFVYFDSGIGQLSKPLQSLQMFQKDTNQEYRSQIQKQNSILAQKLKALNQQKEQLREFNDSLEKFQEEFEMIEAHFSEKLSSQIKKRDQAQFFLQQEEEKTAFLLELVRKSGSQNLIDQVEGLVKAQKQSQEARLNAQ